MPTVRRNTYNYIFDKVCGGGELRTIGKKQTHTTSPRVAETGHTDGCSVLWRPALAYAGRYSGF